LGNDGKKKEIEKKNVHFPSVGGTDDGKGRFFVVDSSRNGKSVVE